jgi:hypothetical protein
VWRFNTAEGDIALYVEGSPDLRSLPVAMVLVLLYYIFYYCYSKKKELCPLLVLSLHIKSYSPYFNIILAHTEL